MNSKLLKQVKGIPGWLSFDEGNFLEEKAVSTEKLKGVIVEIGSFCGKSTIFIAQTRGKTYSIDPHTGDVEPNLKFPSTYKKFVKNINKAHVQNKVVPVVATSKEAAKNWKKKIRFLFIDALHDEKNSLSDFELWSKHVVDGGIIAMHDSFLRWCGSEDVALKNIVLSADFYKIGVKDTIVYGFKDRGSMLQRINKLPWQIYIFTAVWLNRAIIVFRNLPAAIKYAGLLTAFSLPLSLVL